MQRLKVPAIYPHTRFDLHKSHCIFPLPSVCFLLPADAQTEISTIILCVNAETVKDTLKIPWFNKSKLHLDILNIYRNSDPSQSSRHTKNSSYHLTPMNFAFCHVLLPHQLRTKRTSLFAVQNTCTMQYKCIDVFEHYCSGVAEQC